MSFRRLLICSAWFVLVAVPVHAEFSVEELEAAYVQAKSELSIASVKTNFQQSFPEHYNVHLGLVRNDLRADVANASSSMFPAMQKGLVPKGEEISSDREVVIQRIMNKLDAELDQMRENLLALDHEFRVNLLREIVAPIDPDDVGPKTPTVSDFRTLQYGSELSKPAVAANSWLCRDARKMGPGALYWSKSRIKLQGMVPPFFAHDSLDCSLDNEVDSLWVDPSIVVNLGIESADESKYQLLAFPLPDDTFLLAAYALAASRLPAVPDWTCQCMKVTAAAPGWDPKLGIDEVRLVSSALFSQVMSLRKREGLSVPYETIVPRYIHFFEEFIGLPDATGDLWYPSKITRQQIERCYTKKAEVETVELNSILDGTLLVSDFKTNEQVAAIVPISVPDGASFLDRDLESGQIVGQPAPVQAIVVSGSRPSRSWFLAANGVLAVLIVGFLVIRRFKSQPQ